MRKNFKYFIFIFILVISVFVTGCSNDPSASFKKPKKLTISKTNCKTTFTYDDDGAYNINKLDTSDKVLINSDKGFRMEFMYSGQTIKQQEQSKGFVKKDNKHVILDDINYNGYKGYVTIHKEYATTDVFLYLDKSKDVIVDIRISTTNSSKTEKEVKNKKVENVLYNKEDVQNILKTIKYERK